MTTINPLFLGISGALSLAFAYLIFRKEPSRSTLVAEATTVFAAHAIVNRGETTVLEHAPHTTLGRSRNTPAITRVFQVRTEDSGSVTKPDQVLSGSDEGLAAPVVHHLGFIDFSHLDSSSKAKPNPRATSAPPPPTTIFAKKSGLPSGRASSMSPHVPELASEFNTIITPGLSQSRRLTGALTRSASRAFVSSATASDPQRTQEASPSPPDAEPVMTPSSSPPPDAEPVLTPSTSSPRKLAKSKIRIQPRSTRRCAYNKHFVNVLANGEAPSTSYFISYGEERLVTPPREIMKMGLVVDDVHLHITPKEKQLWIYEDTENSGKPAWKAIELGYVRPLDKRGLSVTKDNKPSFVAPKWAGRGIKSGKKKMVEMEIDEESGPESEEAA